MDYRNRQSVTSVTPPLQPVTVEVEVGQSVTTAPSTQNTDEQEAAKSTKSGVPVVTAVTFSDEVQPFLKQPDIGLLPEGVSKPTGQRTVYTQAMPSQYLRTQIRFCKGLDWIASSEYAEIIYRLLTLSIEQLDTQGQFVPAWRLRQDPAQTSPVDEVEVKVEC